MILEQGKTVAEIVTERPNAAIIFKKYEIDFCCKGGRPLEEVCNKNGLDAQQLLREIEMLAGRGSQNLRIESWPMGLICEYIVNNHHTYVKATLPQLLMMAERVAEVHGKEMSSLVELNFTLQELAVELQSHLEKEEQQLFPLIKKSEETGTFQKEEWGSLVAELYDEHSAAGEHIHKIRALSQNFSYPDWACNTFKALYFNLEEFQDDLFQHIHLENNVLFPKVKEALK